MKKIILTFILTFYASITFAQVYSVFDYKSNEVYGYIVFELVEKVDKKQSLYIATLLDINLNKVSQATFTDEKDIRIRQVRYNGSSVFFNVLPQGSNKSTNFSFRIYDLKSNTISPNYTLPETDKNTYVMGSYPIQNTGYGLIVRNFKTQVNHLYAVTDSNKHIYTVYPYGNTKKKEAEAIYLAGIYDNLMITINRKYPTKKSSDPKTTLLLIDLITGKVTKEISFDNNVFNVDLSNVQITRDNIYVFGDTYEKKKEITSGKTSGLFKAIIDHNGTILSENSLVWADLQSKIDIKEGGFVRNKGYIYTHSYVFDKKTKNTVVVGEYIRGSITSVSVRDLVFMEFDEKFNLNQVFEVEKKQSTLNLGGIKTGGSRQFGGILSQNNYFDYRFYNFLEEESGLSFFYFNTEKLYLIGSSSFSHGIVVYKDGKFSAEKLKWESSIWKRDRLNLLPSKPGYFLLSKVSKDKVVENRLERIDY